MGTPEKTFLAVLVLLGLCFQVRLWREWRRGKYRKGFYVFGLTFCCVVEARAADAAWSDRIGSHSLSAATSILTALACLGVAFWIARVRLRPEA
jgi:hypothetical protein